MTQLSQLNVPSAMGITLEAQPNVWCCRAASPMAESEKDEKDFDPVVPNDVAAHAPAAQVHAELLGHDMKEMVVMDEQAFEAEDVAVLGTRRRRLKISEVVPRKMSIDDSTASPAHTTFWWSCSGGIRLEARLAVMAGYLCSV
ncbi:hypothetical protein EDB89DRAFT_2229852 [Lactarius sanguifluus]|nr:hypothetical protein EDB89DRAFT_2229852 [Lactarius sanguifluus]